MCGEDVQTGGVAGFAVAAAGQGDDPVVLLIPQHQSNVPKRSWYVENEDLPERNTT
jgi:hypothetical protein